MDGKDDFIGKRVNDAKKIFGMAREDAFSLLIVLLIVGNIVFASLWVSAKNETIKVIYSLNDRINEEIRRQVQPVVSQEVTKQVRPIKEGVDTVKNKAAEVFDKILK